MSIRHFFLMIVSLLSILGANAQEAITLLSARGTGRTTGHIITLSVRNNTSRAVEVAPDVFYLPSDGRHQSYVGRIPEGIVIPPGGTIPVTVTGYCTDIFIPPVPADEPTLSGDHYIVVGPPPSSSPDLVSVFPTPPVAPFGPASISAITNSSGFKPLPPAPEAALVPTWPIAESSIPIGGTMLPDLDPRIFGPLIVTIVEQIENASSRMQAEGSLHTPFSGNPAAELDAVIQQTTWLVIGLVTGEAYGEEDFAENVYEQFTNRTGAPVSSLPEEEKERLDSGVTDFWNTFTAVGLEAKVISHP